MLKPKVALNIFDTGAVVLSGGMHIRINILAKRVIILFCLLIKAKVWKKSMKALPRYST